VTWDEDDGSSGNRIATIMVGQRVKPGQYKQRVDHYGVLRMVEGMYGLQHAGESSSAQAIVGMWVK